MAQIDLILNAKPRRWFMPAFAALCITGALLDLAKLPRAAAWVSDKGTDFLARYGVVVGTKPKGR